MSQLSYIDRCVNCGCGCSKGCTNCARTMAPEYDCPPTYGCTWYLTRKGKRISSVFKLLNYGQPMQRTSDFVFLFNPKKPAIGCHLMFDKLNQHGTGKVYINTKDWSMYWKKKGNDFILFDKTNEYVMTQCQTPVTCAYYQ